MPKILLFRVAPDLSARLVAELSRAGYDVVTSESADVRTVIEHQPDLVLLQTDVRTLDCCGLLTLLKGNDATAPVKIILLAEGGGPGTKPRARSGSGRRPEHSFRARRALGPNPGGAAREGAG